MKALRETHFLQNSCLSLFSDFEARQIKNDVISVALHDERLMVAIPLQCLFIIQMPNRRGLINALHYAWELRC